MSNIFIFKLEGVVVWKLRQWPITQALVAVDGKPRTGKQMGWNNGCDQCFQVDLNNCASVFGRLDQTFDVFLAKCSSLSHAGTLAEHLNECKRALRS